VGGGRKGVCVRHGVARQFGVAYQTGEARSFLGCHIRPAFCLPTLPPFSMSFLSCSSFIPARFLCLPSPSRPLSPSSLASSFLPPQPNLPAPSFQVDSSWDDSLFSPNAMRGVLPPFASAFPSSFPSPPSASPPRGFNRTPWALQSLPPPPPASLLLAPVAASLAPAVALGAVALILLGALLLTHNYVARPPAAGRTSLRARLSAWLGMRAGGKEEEGAAPLTRPRPRTVRKRPPPRAVSPASDSGGEADAPTPRPRGSRS
jgi:hypothetical protein